MADEEEDARRPFVEYSDDKTDPDNIVLVKVDIPGLKKKAKLFRPFGGPSGQPGNATVTLELKERSFKLKVLLQKPKQMFLYSIKKLPEPIDADKSCYKVLRKDEVCIYLYKVTPGRWDGQLSSVGLETSLED